MDIIAIDNTLVDLVVKVSEESLATYGVIKGQDNFLSEEQLGKLLHLLEDVHTIPGGAAANVVSLMARLGSTAGFCGKLGNDQHGELFASSLKQAGVENHLVTVHGHTGKALTFVTPDAQRTFALHLGVSTQLSSHDLPEAAISNTKLLYLTGFLFADKGLRKTAEAAAAIARSNKTKVVLDLADPGIIAHNREYFEEFLPKCDIIFANEEEAHAFTGVSAESSASALGSIAELVVIKRGAAGSIIRRGSELHVHEISPVKPIDTTGAGDAYAAGFLHTYLQGKALEECATLGSALSAAVVQQLGARLETIPANTNL